MASAGGQRLLTVQPDSTEGQRLLRDIRGTYLDTQYRTSLNFEQLMVVRNDALARKFQDKKRELYTAGGNSLIQEMHVFACFKKQESVLSIINDGVMVKPSLYNYLGRSDLGVNLCRHADVQLKSAESGRSRVKKCWLVVFKVLPGRTRNIPADESVTYPTPNFDSHTSSVRAQVTDSLHVQAINSQIYLYEFTSAQQLAVYPSTILPYAVLTFSKDQPGQSQPRSMQGVTQPPAQQQPQPAMQQQTSSSHAVSGSILQQQQRLLSHGNIRHRPPPLTPISSQVQPQSNYSVTHQTSQAPLTDPLLRAPYPEHISGFNFQQPNVGQNIRQATSEMRYPPNQTATSTQLPFHAGETSNTASYQQLLQLQKQQQLLLRQQQQQQQQQKQQNSSNFGTAGLSSNLPPTSTATATISYRPSASSAVIHPTSRPGSSGLGMRLPTVVATSSSQTNQVVRSIDRNISRLETDRNTVTEARRLAPSHATAAVSGSAAATSASSFPSVITIQPEGTAPHEDPSLLGVWPWVKTEPQTTGYNSTSGDVVDDPYSYTLYLKDVNAGTAVKPIVIEPIDSVPMTSEENSMALVGNYTPSVHSDTSVPLDLSLLNTSDYGGERNMLPITTTIGTSINAAPLTSKAGDGLDPVSNRTQSHEPLSDKDEFQRLYGSENCPATEGYSTSHASNLNIAHSTRSINVCSTLTEHGTSKPRSSVVSVSGTWDVPLLATGSDGTTKSLSNSEVSLILSRKATEETQVNVLTVTTDNSSNIHNAPTMSALLSSSTFSPTRTVESPVSVISSTVGNTYSSKSSLSAIKIGEVSSNDSSVAITTGTTTVTTTMVDTTVVSSSMVSTTGASVSLVASTSQLNVDGRPGEKYQFSNQVKETEINDHAAELRLTQPINTTCSTDVNSSISETSITNVTSHNAMSYGNIDTTSKSSILQIPKVASDKLTLSNSLSNLRKLKSPSSSPAAEQTSESETVNVHVDSVNDSLIRQITKTERDSTNRMQSSSRQSNDINIEPLELSFSSPSTSEMENHVVSQNGSASNHTAEKNETTHVDTKDNSQSKSPDVLTVTKAVSNLKGQQDFQVAGSSQNLPQQHEYQNQSISVSSQSVSNATKISESSMQSDKSVAQSSVVTDSGTSVVPYLSEKCKIKRLQKKKGNYQYSIPLSFKKVIDRQKVIVAEDGTIQLITESVYTCRTNIKDISTLARQDSTLVCNTTSSKADNNKENKKSKKLSLKVNTNNNTVTKPETTKVIIASQMDKRKVAVSKKSGSPRSHLHSSGKSGIKQKLKGSKKSFAVKSSSLSSTNFVKPKQFVSPFERFDQSRKAPASAASGEYSIREDSQGQHLSFGLLESSIGIGSLLPPVTKRNDISGHSETEGNLNFINVKEAKESKKYQPFVKIECDIQKHLHKYKLYNPSRASNLLQQPRLIPLVMQNEENELPEEETELTLKISEVTSLERTAFNNGDKNIEAVSASDEGLVDSSSMSDTGIDFSRKVNTKGKIDKSKPKKIQVTVKPLATLNVNNNDTDDIETDMYQSKVSTKKKKKKKKTKKKSKEQERVPPLIVQTKRGRTILNSEVSEDDTVQDVRERSQTKKVHNLKLKQSQSKKELQQSDSDSDVVRKKKKRRPRILSKKFIEESDESDPQTVPKKSVSPIKLIIQNSATHEKDFRILPKSDRKQDTMAANTLEKQDDHDITSKRVTEKKNVQVPEMEDGQTSQTDTELSQDIQESHQTELKDSFSNTFEVVKKVLSDEDEKKDTGFTEEEKVTEKRYDGRAALPDVVMSSKEVCENETRKCSNKREDIIEQLKTQNEINSFIKSCRIESDKAKSKHIPALESGKERKYKKRTRSRSYSRSPDRYRRRRSHSCSRSRSRSPSYRRSKRSRRYSRSPSPRSRYSRSPRSRRRYSRSPSPYRSRHRSSRHYSPRRRYSSRSPSPRRRYSRSPTLRRRRSRSLSPRRKRSDSRSPGKTFKSSSVNQVKGTTINLGNRPYSPSSPTESPTKELSPVRKKVLETRKTAVDVLFDIAYGKTPVTPVQPEADVKKSFEDVSSTLKTDTETVVTSTEIVETDSSVSTLTAASDAKTASKKLSFSQYKKRHSKGSVDSSLEGDEKSKNRATGRDSETEIELKDVDDADIVHIQEQYAKLKATIDTMPADEDKLEFMIEYKRVGDQLKNLRAQQCGKSSTAVTESLDPLKVNFAVKKQSWPTTSTPLSPRAKQGSSGGGQGLWRLSSSSSTISEKADWDISTFEPESEKRVEMYNAYGGAVKDPNNTSGTDEIDYKAILDSIEGIPKALGLPPTTMPATVNPDAVQNILNLAKAQSSVGLTASTSVTNVRSLMSGIKPLMSEPKLPTTSLSRSSSVPGTSSNDQPAFYTNINTSGAIKKNMSIFTKPVSVRDPRLNRKDSIESSSSHAGLSPRDGTAVSPRGGTSPRINTVPLCMGSPPHISPRQTHQPPVQHHKSGQLEPQPSVYNPPPLNRRHPQQQRQQSLPNPAPHTYTSQLAYIPLPDTPKPDLLRLIPIDVPEINYSGIKGSLDDPRFMPRDSEVWNPIPLKGPPRHIPLDVAKIYENDDMEISDTEDANQIIDSNDISSNVVEQATATVLPDSSSTIIDISTVPLPKDKTDNSPTSSKGIAVLKQGQVIKSPNPAIAARDPRLLLAVQKSHVQKACEKPVHKPANILNDNNSSNIDENNTGMSLQTQKRPIVTGAQWSNLSKNWDNIGTVERQYISHNIGGANKQTLSLITAAESISSVESNDFFVEMNTNLDITLSNVDREKLFHDPTEGIDPERRAKLIADGSSINPAVLGELKLEHHLFQLDKVIKTLKETLANLSDQIQQPNCVPTIVTDYDQNEERLHAVELAREHEHKRLEKELRRYQKSECVEVVPKEFLLSGEVDGYISEEGCLLFLVEQLSLVDCRNLYSYKVEVEKCKEELEKLSGIDITKVRKCRKAIGYWHSQRKLLLINICCASQKKKQELTERFIDKLAWYRTVQNEIERQEGNASTKEVMLAFAAERIESFETYLNILRHVQLCKNGWEAIQYEEEKVQKHTTPLDHSLQSSTSVLSAPSANALQSELKEITDTSPDSISKPKSIIKSSSSLPSEVRNKTKGMSFALKEKLKMAESLKNDEKSSKNVTVTSSKASSSTESTKRKSLDEKELNKRKSSEVASESEIKNKIRQEFECDSLIKTNSNTSDKSKDKNKSTDKLGLIERKVKDCSSKIHTSHSKSKQSKKGETSSSKSSETPVLVIEEPTSSVEKAVPKSNEKKIYKDTKKYNEETTSNVEKAVTKSNEKKICKDTKKHKEESTSNVEKAVTKSNEKKICKDTKKHNEEPTSNVEKAVTKSNEKKICKDTKKHNEESTSSVEKAVTKSNEKKICKDTKKHNEEPTSNVEKAVAKSNEKKICKHTEKEKSISDQGQKHTEKKSSKENKDDGTGGHKKRTHKKLESQVSKESKSSKTDKELKNKEKQTTEMQSLVSGKSKKNDSKNSKSASKSPEKKHSGSDHKTNAIKDGHISKSESHKSKVEVTTGKSSAATKSKAALKGASLNLDIAEKEKNQKHKSKQNNSKSESGKATISSSKERKGDVSKERAHDKSKRRSNSKEPRSTSNQVAFTSNEDSNTKELKMPSKDSKISSTVDSSKEKMKSVGLKDHKSSSQHEVATSTRRSQGKTVKVVVIQAAEQESLQACLSPGKCDSLGFKKYVKSCSRSSSRESSVERDSIPNIVKSSLSNGDDKSKSSYGAKNILDIEKALSGVTNKVSVHLPKLVLKRTDENIVSGKLGTKKSTKAKSDGNSKLKKTVAGSKLTVKKDDNNTGTASLQASETVVTATVTGTVAAIPYISTVETKAAPTVTSITVSEIMHQENIKEESLDILSESDITGLEKALVSSLQSSYTPAKSEVKTNVTRTTNICSSGKPNEDMCGSDTKKISVTKTSAKRKSDVKKLTEKSTDSLTAKLESIVDKVQGNKREVSSNNTSKEQGIKEIKNEVMHSQDVIVCSEQAVAVDKSKKEQIDITEKCSTQLSSMNNDDVMKTVKSSDSVPSEKVDDKVLSESELTSSVFGKSQDNVSVSQGISQVKLTSLSLTEMNSSPKVCADSIPEQKIQTENDKDKVQSDIEENKSNNNKSQCIVRKSNSKHMQIQGIFSEADSTSISLCDPETSTRLSVESSSSKHPDSFSVKASTSSESKLTNVSKEKTCHNDKPIHSKIQSESKIQIIPLLSSTSETINKQTIPTIPSPSDQAKSNENKKITSDSAKNENDNLKSSKTCNNQSNSNVTKLDIKTSKLVNVPIIQLVPVKTNFVEENKTFSPSTRQKRLRSFEDVKEECLKKRRLSTDTVKSDSSIMESVKPKARTIRKLSGSLESKYHAFRRQGSQSPERSRSKSPGSKRIRSRSRSGTPTVPRTQIHKSGRHSPRSHQGRDWSLKRRMSPHMYQGKGESPERSRKRHSPSRRRGYRHNSRSPERPSRRSTSHGSSYPRRSVSPMRRRSPSSPPSGRSPMERLRPRGRSPPRMESPARKTFREHHSYSPGRNSPIYHSNSPDRAPNQRRSPKRWPSPGRGQSSEWHQRNSPTYYDSVERRHSPNREHNNDRDERYQSRHLRKSPRNASQRQSSPAQGTWSTEPKFENLTVQVGNDDNDTRTVVSRGRGRSRGSPRGRPRGRGRGRASLSPRGRGRGRGTRSLENSYVGLGQFPHDQDERIRNPNTSWSTRTDDGQNSRELARSSGRSLRSSAENTMREAAEIVDVINTAVTKVIDTAVIQHTSNPQQDKPQHNLPQSETKFSNGAQSLTGLPIIANTQDMCHQPQSQMGLQTFGTQVSQPLNVPNLNLIEHIQMNHMQQQYIMPGTDINRDQVPGLLSVGPCVQQPVMSNIAMQSKLQCVINSNFEMQNQSQPAVGSNFEIQNRLMFQTKNSLQLNHVQVQENQNVPEAVLMQNQFGVIQAGLNTVESSLLSILREFSVIPTRFDNVFMNNINNN